VLNKVIFTGAAARNFLLHIKTPRDYFKQNSHSCPGNEVFLVQDLTELFKMLTNFFELGDYLANLRQEK